ncbi:hypothetical protein O181_070097 [Austropuccinia psidii MF-1]|uniref:Uncharacterized protein n=1 Tax=Austropuccinia psidii MF-1 TaxID=1389203 RepID=A0A9Q3I7X9_9BASI|nr:hypothetical protein [Austropuccinia psidii MF-1]
MGLGLDVDLLYYTLGLRKRKSPYYPHSPSPWRFQGDALRFRLGLARHVRCFRPLLGTTVLRSLLSYTSLTIILHIALLILPYSSSDSIIVLSENRSPIYSFQSLLFYRLLTLFKIFIAISSLQLTTVLAHLIIILSISIPNFFHLNPTPCSIS